MEKRTDLALEVRESFPKDHVEISGVALEEKNYFGDRIRVTTVEIRNRQGENQMKKPMGRYVTIEFTEKNKLDDREKWRKTQKQASQKMAQILEDMVQEKENRGQDRQNRGQEGQRGTKEVQSQGVYLVAGLGNRFATPDALGPFVLDDIAVNRHIKKEFGQEIFQNGEKELCAVSPGVMGQTGMESQEILGGIIERVKPSCLFVVDSLASRSVGRLCTTIQITDTGICPGSGIGNNRNALNEKNLHVPVIAIGVPTVVDAGTIVSECMEETLLKEGYSQDQVDIFLQSLSKERTGNLFVTPKDIDEQVRTIGKVLANGINLFAKME